MATPKTVRILSIDGGGCRGYFSACFLERFIYQWGISPNALWQHFDVIAGTSIGGIQACGYANKMSPTELKPFFLEKSPWIFTIRSALDVATGSINASNPSHRPDTLQKIVMIGVGNPFYKATDPASNYGDSRLKTELNAVFASKLMNQLATNVVIPSYEQINSTPILFSNVDLPGFIGADYCIKDIALSTGSAPIYFPATGYSTEQFVDGGIFQNNPVLFGWELGKMLYPDAKRFCILSVGTGLGDVGFHVPTGQPAPSEGIAQLFSLIGVEMAAAQEGNHKLLEFASSLENSNISYYRFQAALDRTIDTELDNSTAELFTYLETAMNTQYNQDAYKIGQFISRLSDG